MAVKPDRDWLMIDRDIRNSIPVIKALRNYRTGNPTEDDITLIGMALYENDYHKDYLIKFDEDRRLIHCYINHDMHILGYRTCHTYRIWDVFTDTAL